MFSYPLTGLEASHFIKIFEKCFEIAETEHILTLKNKDFVTVTKCTTQSGVKIFFLTEG